MPRRKTTEVEVLPADEKPKSRKKAVTAKHTVTYEAPEIVDVPIDEDEEIILEGDLDDEIEEKPKRRPQKNERDELRKKLAQSNVTPASQLKLSIEKYLHSDTEGGGTWAEAEHCTKYACTEAHITGEDYLEVARKWGTGTYRFTLRMNNKIVTAWDKRISAGAAASTSVMQNAIPGDPTSPQVVVQMPNNPQQPAPPADPLVQLRNAFKIVKEFKADLGLDVSQQSQPTPLPLDPKIAALQLFAESPDVMERVGAGIAKIAMGNRGGHHESTWTDVAMEAIKSGQASEIVAAILREIMAPFRNVLGGNNGQETMAATQAQNPPQVQIGQRANDAGMANAGAQGQSAISQGNQDAGVAGSAASPEEQILTPLLAFVVQQCANQTQPEIVANSVNNFLNQVAEQAPLQYPAVLAQVDLFGEMGTDAALEFVKQYPNGEQVAAMSHAKEWTEKLQKLIRESKEGESDET